MQKEKKYQNPVKPTEWVDLYGNYLYRFALGRVRNPEEAENLVQETFLAALAARENFSGRSSEQTWLVGILKHKIIDNLRRKYRERPVTDFMDDEKSIDSFYDQTGHPIRLPSDWLPDPAQLLTDKEFWLTLRLCLKKLPPPIHDAFLLREIEKMDSKLICKILNVTPNNLWVMLHRARLQLRACLEDNWFNTQKSRKGKQPPSTKL